MTDGEDQSRSGIGIRLAGRIVSAGVLAGGGIFHMVKPALLTLDWPGVAVVLIAILLFFVPIENIGSIIESLEIGNTKILLRKTQRLREDVALATESKGKPLGRIRTNDQAFSSVSPVPGDASRSNSELSAPAESLNDIAVAIKEAQDARLTALLGDKSMTLIRIGIEIERAINDLLAKQQLPAQRRDFGIASAISTLLSQKVISPEIANSLKEFQAIRNQIVHATKSVPEGVLTSTIDSGLQLLDFLRIL